MGESVNIMISGTAQNQSKAAHENSKFTVGYFNMNLVLVDIRNNLTTYSKIAITYLHVHSN